MSRNSLIAASAFLVVLSFFLPWLTIPFGGTLSPYGLVSGLSFKQVTSMPFGMMLFLLSFILAAIVGGLALRRKCPPQLAVSAGVLPLLLVGYTIIQALSEGGNAGLPMPRMRDMGDIFDVLGEVMGLGLPLYVLAAIALTMVSIRGLRARDNTPASPA